MALSDIVQLDYSINNEIARNATKNFADMLGKAFEQYKKLWNEYLKLRKHCEDANFKIPFQLLESDNCNVKDIYNNDINTLSQTCGCFIRSSDTNQVLSKNIETCIPVCASTPTICSSGINSDVDDNINEIINKQPKQDKLLNSPELIRSRFKSKRSNIVVNYPSFQDSKENIIQQYMPIKENLPVLANTSQQSALVIEPKEDECSVIENNNDEIKGTPMLKIPKKLSVSKLYNVDSTLLKNGKILKQSKLVFVSPKQSADEKFCSANSNMSSIPEKMINDKSKDQNKSVEEEIIQGSPNKHLKSNLRKKGMKVKRKTPIKIIQKNKKRKDILDIYNDNTNFNQYLLSPCTPKQEAQLSSLRRLKTFSSSYETVKKKHEGGSPLSIIDNCENVHFTDVKNLSTPVKKSKNVKIMKNVNQTGNMSWSELINQNVHIDSSMSDDETFCILGEKLKQIPDCKINKLQNAKENSLEHDVLQTSPSVKRSLMNSFDMPSKKENIHINQPSKKKSDRKKMIGVTCWECEKYYANLGLSEEDIKIRQNQCSRHKTNYRKRQNTPEGFWDPVFPDTCSSTLQND